MEEEYIKMGVGSSGGKKTIFLLMQQALVFKSWGSNLVYHGLRQNVSTSPRYRDAVFIRVSGNFFYVMEALVITD